MHDTHYHIHYGDPDELGENDEAALDLPVHRSLGSVLTDVASYLAEYRKMVVAENPADLTLYRSIKDAGMLLSDIDEEQASLIESVGVELEIAEGESVSIIPCRFGGCD